MSDDSREAQNIVLLFGFGLGTILNLVAVFMGLSSIVSASNTLTYILCSIASIIVASLCLAMRYIFGPANNFFLVILWLAATLCNGYATLVCCVEHIGFKHSWSETGDQSALQILLSIPRELRIATVFVAGVLFVSPMFVSYLSESKVKEKEVRKQNTEVEQTLREEVKRKCGTK